MKCNKIVNIEQTQRSISAFRVNLFMNENMLRKTTKQEREEKKPKSVHETYFSLLKINTNANVLMHDKIVHSLRFTCRLQS